MPGKFFVVKICAFSSIFAIGLWAPFIQIIRAQVAVDQITNTVGSMAANNSASISADGTRIAFISDRNITGTNAKENNEVFLWTADAGFMQITDTIGGGITTSPRISADGFRIAFVSDRDLTGENPDSHLQIFL